MGSRETFPQTQSQIDEGMEIVSPKSFNRASRKKLKVYFRQTREIERNVASTRMLLSVMLRSLNIRRALL